MFAACCTRSRAFFQESAKLAVVASGCGVGLACTENVETPAADPQKTRDLRYRGIRGVGFGKARYARCVEKATDNFASILLKSGT
jgi:hypothetical protein